MALDAGDINLRREVLEHLAQTEHLHWMNARTSCTYTVNNYGLDADDVFAEHVQVFKDFGLVEKSHERIT